MQVTQQNISPHYRTYRTFYVSRINTWQPRIYNALITMAESVANGALMPDIAPLTDVIKRMYIDAGAVLGSHSYQYVSKQGKAKGATKQPLSVPIIESKALYNEFADLFSRLETKRLLPIGYNEQLIALITRYYQTSLFNDAVLPISETIRDEVLARLTLAQQQGDSIQQVITDLKPYLARRAEVIARTETVKAANYGAKQGAILTGYAMNKIWISAQDNRTRRVPRDEADHLHMNGIEIGMDELFSVPSKGGIILMDRPGDIGAPASSVVNCRCALGFRVL